MSMHKPNKPNQTLAKRSTKKHEERNQNGCLSDLVDDIKRQRLCEFLCHCCVCVLWLELEWKGRRERVNRI